MGSAPGKQKGKTVYIADKGAKKGENVSSEQKETSEPTVAESAEQTSFEEMVKQAAAVPATQTSTPSPKARADILEEVDSPQALLSPSSSVKLQDGNRIKTDVILPQDTLVNAPEKLTSPSSTVEELTSPSSTVKPQDAAKNASHNSVAAGKRTTNTVADFSSDSEYSDVNPMFDDLDSPPIGGALREQEAERQEAMEAVKKATQIAAGGHEGFAEALREGYRQCSLGRERWLKSLGVEAQEPTVVKADVRTSPASVSERASLSAGPSLRDPNIMEEVQLWNAKIKPVEPTGGPKLTAVR